MKYKYKEYLLDDLIYKTNLLKKKENAIIGFTNGCFDLLHKGHLYSLRESKKRCDYLIVAVNSDISVKLLKGNDRPIDNAKVRLKKLAAINDVDALIIFNEETPIRIIDGLKPNILFKGADYKYKKVVGSESVIKSGGKVEFIEMINGISTSNIINSSSI